MRYPCFPVLAKRETFDGQAKVCQGQADIQIVGDYTEVRDEVFDYDF